MKNTYKTILNLLLKSDDAMMTKLYLFYELAHLFDYDLNDDDIEELYQEYLDSYQFENISQFIRFVVDRFEEESED